MATVRCVFAAEIQMDIKRPCGMHTHACSELVFYLDGHGRLVQSGRRFSYQPGSVSTYQPGEEHADIPESGGTQLCVGVVGCGAEQLPSGMWKADDSLADGFRRILQEIRCPLGGVMQDRLDILAGWVVLELQRVIGKLERDDGMPAPVKVARDILDSRFNQTIDMQELAGSLFISPDYLRHIFKQCLGESPLNYLIRRRLRAACEMLNLTDLPVHEVACRVGLENPYYFSRIFRKRLGLTPSQYRAQARRK